MAVVLSHHAVSACPRLRATTNSGISFITASGAAKRAAKSLLPFWVSDPERLDGSLIA
jgi:hypothetical protein